MESCVGGLRGCIFSCSRGNCTYFPFPNSLFDIFWHSINLAYVSQLGEEDLVQDYLFDPQSKSHSVPDMDFFCAISSLISPICSYQD